MWSASARQRAASSFTTSDWMRRWWASHRTGDQSARSLSEQVQVVVSCPLRSLTLSLALSIYSQCLSLFVRRSSHRGVRQSSGPHCILGSGAPPAGHSAETCPQHSHHRSNLFARRAAIGHQWSRQRHQGKTNKHTKADGSLMTVKRWKALRRISKHSFHSNGVVF